MKLKYVVIAMIIACCSNLYSQKSFSKGYYIDVNKNRIECLIKDEDWDFNPTEFTTKADENSRAEVISYSQFLEFGVNEFKFIKANTKVDKSSDHFGNLEGSKALNLVDATLVLRVLIEGDANLYRYKNEIFTRFFYAINNSPITQLSYKMYPESGGYNTNNTYRQELLNTLKCEKITQADIDRLEYENDKLSNLFKEYNLCKSGVMRDFRPKKIINTLEVYAKIGIGISSLKYEDLYYSADFDTKTKFRPAIELEINLSNKRKNYSGLIEISYQRYKSTTNTGFASLDLEADYKTIDIAAGVRKYFNLNSKVLLFINGYMASGLSGGSKFENFDVRSNLSPSLGIGGLYNKRYTLDLKYEFGRDIIASYRDRSAEYNTIAVSLGYKLL